MDTFEKNKARVGLKTSLKGAGGLPEGLGKLPPQAKDLEEAVLGAVLTERNALTDILDILRPEMFYVEANQIIFEACMRLSMESGPIDLLSVANELRNSGELEAVGGAHYLTTISDRVVSSANIEYHARIVAEMYVKRELIKQCSKTIQDCYNDTEDIFDIISATDMHRDEMLNKVTTNKEISNLEAVEAVFEHMQKMQLNPVKGLSGIPSGFPSLDRITGGWQKSDLVILAARPAMGKTSLALQMAINAAEIGNPVAVFSIEMAYSQLIKKTLSIQSEVPYERIHKNKFYPEDWAALTHFKPIVANLPIQWDDTPSINITELVAKAKRMKRKHDIQMIIIDYLQIITTPRVFGRNREQEISYISRSLKALAKELDIPVIALSQLSRAVEQRPSKRPMLSDLRESGSIEQDADIVTFLYRPEYYQINEDENGYSTAGLAEFMIAKHRNGETGDVKLRFLPSTTGFKDYDDYGFMPVGGNVDGPFDGLSPNKSF